MPVMAENGYFRPKNSHGRNFGYGGNSAILGQSLTVTVFRKKISFGHTLEICWAGCSSAGHDRSVNLLVNLHLTVTPVQPLMRQCRRNNELEFHAYQMTKGIDVDNKSPITSSLYQLFSPSAVHSRHFHYSWTDLREGRSRHWNTSFPFQTQIIALAAYKSRTFHPSSKNDASKNSSFSTYSCFFSNRTWHLTPNFLLPRRQAAIFPTCQLGNKKAVLNNL